METADVLFFRTVELCRKITEHFADNILPHTKTRETTTEPMLRSRLKSSKSGIVIRCDNPDITQNKR
jgi:hypothetical protein